MPPLRNKLSEVTTGGPRQFAELRDKLIIEASDQDELGEVSSEIFRFGFDTDELSNSPILIAEPRDKIQDTVDILSDRLDDPIISDAADSITGMEEEEQIDVDSVLEEATNRVQDRIMSIPGVAKSSFVLSYTDYGPENLRLAPEEMTTLAEDALDIEGGTLGSLNEKFDMEKVWEEERGDGAIAAIFDTGYSRGLFSSNRIINTFHGGGTDNVFASAEGHGTMTAGAMAASTEDGVPFNGAAPGADVMLVRITDENGQIRSDLISKGYDAVQSMNTERPIVANHSYGMPICSGRPRTRFCDSPEQDLVRTANSGSDLTSVYAAGNEAMTCGHRPSGITSAVTGTNSLADVITVGALRFDGREAQSYSSHGRGDCAPVADPKPNVSAAIPAKTYYGTEDGWEIKDMSSGIGGSSGGTSHASPWTAGIVTLMQSKAFKERGEPLQTEELKQVLHNTSDVPHRSLVNTFGIILSEAGYDARFGHGQVKPRKALQEI